MLGWFDTKEVDAFAAALVEDLVQRVPLASLRRGSDKRFHRMTEVLSDRVRAFASSHRPNVYKRARLGNQVKWALKEAGYPEDFVDAFTSELVTLATVASKARG